MTERTGDEDFDAFVAAVSGRLLHAADLLTGDRARGEDLVQHGLAVAYSRWSTLRGGHPEAYVRKVMLHRYLDWWRRVRWREQPILHAADPAGPRHTTEPPRVSWTPTSPAATPSSAPWRP